eukprot:2675281-Rhodomonas_salina.6
MRDISGDAADVGGASADGVWSWAFLTNRRGFGGNMYNLMATAVGCVGSSWSDWPSGSVDCAFCFAASPSLCMSNYGFCCFRNCTRTDMEPSRSAPGPIIAAPELTRVEVSAPARELDSTLALSRTCGVSRVEFLGLGPSAYPEDPCPGPGEHARSLGLDVQQRWSTPLPVCARGIIATPDADVGSVPAGGGILSELPMRVHLDTAEFGLGFNTWKELGQTALPTVREMEAGFGHDLSNVNAQALAVNLTVRGNIDTRAVLGAKVYVVFDGSQVPPPDRALVAQELEAHEAAHVVQQSRGGRRVLDGEQPRTHFRFSTFGAESAKLDSALGVSTEERVAQTREHILLSRQVGCLVARRQCASHAGMRRTQADCAGAMLLPGAAPGALCRRGNNPHPDPAPQRRVRDGEAGSGCRGGELRGARLPAAVAGCPRAVDPGRARRGAGIWGAGRALLRRAPRALPRRQPASVSERRAPPPRRPAGQAPAGRGRRRSAGPAPGLRGRHRAGAGAGGVERPAASELGGLGLGGAVSQLGRQQQGAQRALGRELQRWATRVL